MPVAHQGQLYNRRKRNLDTGEFEYIDAITMEFELKNFRKEYEYYVDWVNKTNQTNNLYSAPNFWEKEWEIPKM